MFKAKYLATALSCAAALFLGASANASVVTSIAGGTVHAFPTVDYFGAGPQIVDSSVTWSSTNASSQGGSVFGYSGSYGFGSNGTWNMDMAGVNDTAAYYGVSDTMTFTFATPQQAVGGFLNWYPDAGDTASIAAYDSKNNLIESYDLTFLTGGGNDSGMFLGFMENSATIKYFTLTNAYIGITNLTTGAVPEPFSLALFGAGLAGFGAIRRRGKSA
jgi:hypothetical protein